METLQKLLFSLCRAAGTPGAEDDIVQVIQEGLRPYGEPVVDAMGNVKMQLGPPDAKHSILIDAHLDQIGMIVTGIDENGFLKIAPCGGVDRRVLPGSQMIVHATPKLSGIVCCLPPHLIEGGEEKVQPVEEMAVDVGLSREEAEKIVSLGDRVTFLGEPRALLGNRVTAAGLDDRAGCAVLIRVAELLQTERLSTRVTFLFSSREETGEQGAQTAAYVEAPDQAIVVDVSFAQQPGVKAEKSGKLSAGPMLGIAPVLDVKMGKMLVEIAKEKEIPLQYEVMGGTAGTNADSIGISRGGVRCAMLSIPERNMHTPVEIVDLEDLENTARLIAEYVRRAD